MSAAKGSSGKRLGKESEALRPEKKSREVDDFDPDLSRYVSASDFNTLFL